MDGMVLLLEILLVAVIIFAIAGYTSGWIPGMQPTVPDRGEDGLPDGALTPPDVDRARFGLAFRGYRMEEVDAVLDRLRDELAAKDAELSALRDGTPPAEAQASVDSADA